MKTRAMAREMTNYMRQVNPQLTAALIDERDQVRMVGALAAGAGTPDWVWQGRSAGVQGRGSGCPPRHCLVAASRETRLD